MTLDLHYQELVTSLTSVGLAPGSTPLIPDFTPTTELIVKYNQRIVSPGNLFRASECKIAPQISFAGEVCIFLALGILPLTSNMIRICLKHIRFC